MSLIIATGSNIGDRLVNLARAKDRLQRHWKLIAESRVYLSAPVDYVEQPDFANQVLQFALPWESPEEVMRQILVIESDLGRVRTVERGPRSVDIDIIFWGLDVIHSSSLNVPHPRWRERSFVVRPAMELPFFHAIQKCFTIPTTFEIEAYPQ